MKFSTRAEYGLRAIAHLHPNAKNPVSLAAVAEKEGLSLAYLERLFAALKRAKIVRAKKGARGGYLLTASARNIKVWDVLIALEGSLAPFACVDKRNSCCVKQCLVHPVWVKMYTEMAKAFSGVNLLMLMKK